MKESSFSNKKGQIIHKTGSLSIVYFFNGMLGMAIYLKTLFKYLSLRKNNTRKENLLIYGRIMVLVCVQLSKLLKLIIHRNCTYLNCQIFFNNLDFVHFLSRYYSFR